MSDRARKNGTVPVIVRLRAAFRPEGQILNTAELLAQRKMIKEAQDQMLAWLRHAPSSIKRYDYVPYIAAVNISLVTDVIHIFTSHCDAGKGVPLKDKIDQLRSLGIATVVAAGNDGFTDPKTLPFRPKFP